ncbi:MAG: phosphoadenylyl-sulfate reductase [Anaerolineae bacterium]|nr:phosphoadenylyl-sulfate reductase [Anaerolineae bacterium]
MHTQLLETLTPLSLIERLQYLAQHYGSDCVFSTSFGQEDQVITDAIYRKKLPIKIFTLDTGRLFHETYALAEETRSRYQATIATYYPATQAVEQLVSEKGFFSFYDSIENRKECCHIRKVMPLQRALSGNKIWITGLRAEQSSARANLPLLSWDDTYQVIKVNPLIDWSYEQVTQYLTTHHVPENPLHHQGFISIGCAPCTRAIAPGEDARTGRWWWESSHKECGLHQK